MLTIKHEVFPGNNWVLIPLDMLDTNRVVYRLSNWGRLTALVGSLTGM
jgi:hypothetical protein